MQEYSLEQTDKKLNSGNIPANQIKLGQGVLGMIFQFLTLKQQFEMRLVSLQFKAALESQLKKLLNITNNHDLETYNKFIAHFENVVEFQLPSICSGTLIFLPKRPEQLRKVMFKQFQSKPSENEKFLENFFLTFQPISIAICEFRYIPLIPDLSKLRELNLLNVMEVKNCEFLKHCSNLVAFAFNVHENDSFFLQYHDVHLPFLKMLKIHFKGPKFDPEKIPGFITFIKSIPKVEVLELLLNIYQSSPEKQMIFDQFMSLPQLRIVHVHNGFKEFSESQLTKTYEYLIIENNKFTQLQTIDDRAFQKLLAFANVLDITNCRLEDHDQTRIQEYLTATRQADTQSFINNRIIRVSPDHTNIQTNYHQYPIVQRNEVFTTLWGSSFYSI